MTNEYPIFQDLPAQERIVKGLADLACGRHSIETCLVRIAAKHLECAGIALPSDLLLEDAELDLYAFFAAFGDNAHSQYNSLIRELISFEQALNHRITRAA
jgi:hypothetical protein